MGLKRKLTRISGCLALVVCSFLTAGRSSLADEEVNEAIDAGIEWLLGQIEKQPVPHWDEKKREPGQVALETYALVVAGASTKHPLIVQNFEYLHKSALRTGYVYTIACYIFALDAAVGQLEQDLMVLEPPKKQVVFKDNPRVGKEYRGYLERAVNMLVSMQNSRGAWHYGGATDKWDNSNTQFAVLGLGVGGKRRIPIDDSVWIGIAEHFIKGQQASGGEVGGRLTMQTEEERAAPRHKSELRIRPKDGGRRSRSSRRSERPRKDKEEQEGRTRTKKATPTLDENPENPEIGTETIKVHQRGWSYNKDRAGGTWNMTCAGLSSLLLARGNLRGRMGGELGASVNRAIRDGYGWLMTHWTAGGQYYGLYSLEKVADIGGVKLFDGHDWYKEVSRNLVGRQRDDGSWPAQGHGGERVATAFALLVLRRATVTTLLTSSNPLDQIILSGKASLQGDPNDRSWVYVADLDRTVHYPTLLRTIRLRPLPKLIKFLRNIVDNYPDMWKGELIPEMARVRDSIPDTGQHRGARRVMEGYLADITGNKYDDQEKYLTWHRRWERVIMIGTQRKKERIDDLLSYYEHTKKSFTLKKSVIWALIRCKAKEALPLFLADLESSDARLRRAAYDGLKAFFIDTPPRFDPAGSDKTRRSQVARIKSWYERQLASSK